MSIVFPTLDAGGLPMVDNLYNETVLDHYKNPRNRGVLEAADFSHEDAGSVCGDEVRIDVRLAEGRVEAIAFSGRGCAVSQASASILTALVAGRSPDEVKRLTNGEFLETTGIPAGSARVECALLSLHVLRVSLFGTDHAVGG
jgi:nitrogen fixation protein NifU and related proteins